MKKTLLFILAITIANIGMAQTMVNVTSNQFTPNNITINQGETVTWNNTQGFHNVNGTQATFPSNPESFGNSLGAGWTFMHTFNTSGTYNYQCDPHVGQGMTGTVTVLLGTGILSIDNSNNNMIEAIYPSPATDLLNIKLNFSELKDLKNAELSIYDLSGKLISVNAISNDQIQLDVSSWTTGVYIAQVQDGNQIVDSGKISVK